MWRETTKHERNLKIWKEELEEFVPKKVLDFHVHVIREGVIPDTMNYQAGGPVVRKYQFEDLSQDLAEAFPGRETFAVCFGIPHPDCDGELNNAYIAEGCDNKRFFGLRLLDPAVDTPEAVDADLATGRLLGLKPYPRYVRKPNVNDATIPEMLPDWAMEIVDRRRQLVMLHIPRKMRLADPLNQQHLVELCTRYPNARIVMAHVGRAYYLQNVVGNLERLRELPNLYVDVSMVQNWEVLEHTIQRLDPGRILYGTDIPIALAPGKAVEINHQYSYVTPNPWQISISDDHGRIRFTSFLNEELRAIKRAVERMGLDRQFVEDFFFNNGMALLESVLAANARPQTLEAGSPRP